MTYIKYIDSEPFNKTTKEGLGLAILDYDDRLYTYKTHKVCCIQFDKTSGVSNTVFDIDHDEIDSDKMDETFRRVIEFIGPHNTYRIHDIMHTHIILIQEVDTLLRTLAIFGQRWNG